MGIDIGSILGGTLAETVKGIISQFHMSPEDKAKAQAAVDQNAKEIQLKQMELQEKIDDANSKEIEAAAANIQAEAKSGDKFTSRSRPSFICMMLLIMVCNYVVFPMINKPPINFPEALFWLFGSCMLGYTGARTWEKLGAGGGIVSAITGNSDKK